MKKLFSLLMALCLLCAALPVVAENANSDRAAAIRAKFLEKADDVPRRSAAADGYSCRRPVDGASPRWGRWRQRSGS